jgi:NDP-sugar pyrophosphorylase family protein
VLKTAVILANDDPTHQSRLLTDRARAMFPAVGKPLIVRVMEQIYRAGIRHFMLTVGVNEGEVAQHLHKRWKPDARLEMMIVTPGDDLFTRLRNVAARLQVPFLLTTYHNFTHEGHAAALLRVAAQQQSPLTLTMARRVLGTGTPLAGPLAHALTAGQPMAEPAYVMAYAAVGDAFVQYLRSARPDARAPYRHSFADIASHYLAEHDPQAASFCEAGWMMTLRSDHDLLLLNKRLLTEQQDTHILSELPLSVRIVPPVRIDPQVIIGEHAVIGPHVYVERGARIGIHAVVRNAVILSRAVVSAHEQLQDTIISTRGRL